MDAFNGVAALPHLPGRNRCLQPVREASRVNVAQPPIFSCSFIATNMEKNYSTGTEEFLVHWSSRLPQGTSFILPPRTIGEDPWLAGLSGSSLAVQRTACHLKTAWGSLCQPTDMSCVCLESSCCLLQGSFSSYSTKSAFLGLETNVQKWSKSYKLLLTKHLRC